MTILHTVIQRPRLLASVVPQSPWASEPFTEILMAAEDRVVHGRCLIGQTQKGCTSSFIFMLNSWSELSCMIICNCKEACTIEAAVFLRGKGNQFGETVSRGLSEDWKRLPPQRRKIKDRRKWHCIKGKRHTKQGICSFYFCFSSMKEDVDCNIKKSSVLVSDDVTSSGFWKVWI